MTNIRSVNEIIQNLIDFYRLTQPDLDIKPGTVARDLFIDAPASQLSILYDELAGVSDKQSLRLVVGSDLDKLAKNFGVPRQQSTPSSGVALLTFSSINAPININKGDIVIANNGFSFSVLNGVSITPSAINFYRSVASRFRDQLDIAGISDTYAAEVTVTATTPGLSGNIGKYSLNRTTISGVSNVTNINAFTGGNNQENDAVFRNRVLSTFSGSSVGTALGYQNGALAVTGVSDAAVIEPGSSLMTRDGTKVKLNADGSSTILSEGSGGKVDIVILGSNLQENTDSFIYKDKSNNNDPTDSRNNIVLGQISGDENKTINRKRIDNIKAGQLPEQPVNQILQLSGSISGSNFIPKSIDSFGRVTGNYELLKDTGVYAGSPWGFDTLHWIDNKISLFEDDKVKGQFNGQDAASFTGLIEIDNVSQNISITNENSTVTSDRSIIKLLHVPCINVTRVLNTNTGERYVVANQNLDNTGTFNTTGRIKISGSTLPSPSDVLQVDYNWIVDYDRYSDFDGLVDTKNARSVTDSIDWGYSNLVKEENVLFEVSAGNNFFVGTTSHPINTVVYANKFTEVDGYVSLVTSGLFVDRLSVTISNLAVQTSEINSVKIKNTNSEVYNTDQEDQTFISSAIVVGIEVLYSTTIILPTDTVASVNDRVTVILNSEDVFNTSSSIGSSSGSQITIPSDQIDTTATAITLKVAYIANVSDLYSSAVTTLPSSRIGNGYITSNNNGFNNFSAVNISRREHQIVQKNISNEYYIEINLLSTDFSLSVSQIISVLRLSDGLELWNKNNQGTITVGNSDNYQIIFNGLNTPAINDRVLIIYYATDSRRYQPFSFSNEIIKSRPDVLTIDSGTGRFKVALDKFVSEAILSFEIFEPNTDIALFTVTDGYLVNNDSYAVIGSPTTDFSTLPDLTNKKVKIISSAYPSNNSIYDIVEYTLGANTIKISSSLDQINFNQISIIRELDGQEIWNSSGTIDVDNNSLILPEDITASLSDKVYILLFKYSNLRQSITRLVSTTTDQIVNAGTITVVGSTINKAIDIVFTATNTGLRLNLSEAVRKATGINSATAISSSIRLAKIAKLEKVTTASAGSDEVISVLTTYDLQNTTIQNNLLFSNDLLMDSSLQSLDFILPSTKNNLLNNEIVNLPKIGDKIRVTFYYVIDNDSENLSYTRNGLLYTNKKFTLINKIYVGSGFRSSQATRLSLGSFTQPNLGSRYKAYYDYIAPKQNERIVVRYNYNNLISNVTFAIENTRPINADVLIRQAKEIKLDLTMNVVISDTYKNSSSTVLQNLRDKLINAMSSIALGQIIDQATLINVAQGVSGIARARILYFNKNGKVGQVLSIQAQADEYFTSNDIIINTETR